MRWFGGGTVCAGSGDGRGTVCAGVVVMGVGAGFGVGIAGRCILTAWLCGLGMRAGYD